MNEDDSIRLNDTGSIDFNTKNKTKVKKSSSNVVEDADAATKMS